MLEPGSELDHLALESDLLTSTNFDFSKGIWHSITDITLNQLQICVLNESAIRWPRCQLNNNTKSHFERSAVSWVGIPQRKGIGSEVFSSLLVFAYGIVLQVTKADMWIYRLHYPLLSK